VSKNRIFIYLITGGTESTSYIGDCLASCTKPRTIDDDDDDDDDVKQSVEWVLAEETEVLGEIMSEYHFVHHKSHTICPGIEPGQPRWEAGD
jgi:hypothetical protein